MTFLHRLDMTQEKLAELMDVSIQMISNLERGNKAIKIDNLVRLSEILGVSTDYILTGREEYSNALPAEWSNGLTERDARLVETVIKYCKNN